MYKGKKIIALIPARGGSKGIFRKNIRPLCGKPLIAWTIEQANKSRYLDKVIVSTDDREIARISTKYGANAPFLRPKKLATDRARLIDVVLHSLRWLKDNCETYDLLMVLQPTSPLRLSRDIDKAIRLLFSKRGKSIISVCEVIEYNPYFINTLPKDFSMEYFEPKHLMGKNRQEMPKFYKMNGAIYLAFSNFWVAKKSYLGKKTYAYLMPKERSIDIDNEFDLKFAEFLIKTTR